MIAVLKYYLLAVEEFGVVPVKLRTDKGTETLLMAEAQFRLREDQEGREMEVRECHLFGPSTRNTKIESWWGQLVSGKVGSLKEMFEGYDMEGEFTGSKWDIMAMQFVYMDTIREHVAKFVRAHNNHLIRKQWRRSNYLATGRPFDLYRNPQPPATKYDQPVNAELLEKLKAEIAAWNPDIYLHPHVVDVCVEILQRHNLPLKPETIIKDDPMHRKMYLTLREELENYENNGGVLLEIETPKQGKEWMWKNDMLQEGRDRIWGDIENQAREENDVEIMDPLLEDWENEDEDADV